MKEYYNFIFMDLMMTLLVVVIAIVILIWLLETLMPTKSKKYRRLMSDMFVVGRIRQLADKYKINIPDQIKDFKNYIKQGRIQEEPIDVTVEKELQEEIADLNAQDFIDKI